MKEFVIESHSVEYWKKIISNLLAGRYSTHNYRFTFGQLYRGRNFKNKPIDDVLSDLSNTKAMWAPPRKFASKGRCNVKGTPILYVSPMVRPLIFELDIKKGDLFAVIKYDVKDYLQPISVAGVKSLSSYNPKLKRILANHFQNRSPECLQLDNFISKVFQMSNGSDIDIYNITIALTHIYWNKPSGKLISRKGVAPSAIGMMYPSVASESIYPNLALKPNEVKGIVKPLEIKLYKLCRCIDYRNIELSEVARTNSIQENGCVSWEKTHRQAVLLVDEDDTYRNYDS